MKSSFFSKIRNSAGSTRSKSKSLQKSISSTTDNNVTQATSSSIETDLTGDSFIHHGRYSASSYAGVVSPPPPDEVDEPPMRKRKSVDRQSIVVSCPPWKSPTVGDKMPNFAGMFLRPAGEGSSCELVEDRDMDFYKCQGDKWGLVLVLPSLDLSRISISELVALACLKDEFERRNVQLVCFTVNPCSVNREWMEEAKEQSDVAEPIYFPIFCDDVEFYDASVDIGVLDEEQTADYGEPFLARTSFLVSPDKKIAMCSTQLGTVGRDLSCFLREIDQIQAASRSVDGIVLAPMPKLEKK